MTVTAPPRRPAPDLDVEREVDLARWRGAVVRLWWLLAAGLVGGAIVGLLFSVTGGTTYKASALISLGQPVAPGGAVVNGYAENPKAVEQVVTSVSAEARAAQRSGVPLSQLRGNVSVAQVGTVIGTTVATRAVPVIQLTVEGKHPNVDAAANALARIAVQDTTAPYEGVKIRSFSRTLKNVNRQLESINRRLSALTVAFKAAGKQNLDPFKQLVLVSQEDTAEARQGNLIQEQGSLQQQLAFATEVESAKVVEGARALKANAHSRGSSLIVGAVIGLILGAVVAIVFDGRTRRRAAVA